MAKTKRKHLAALAALADRKKIAGSIARCQQLGVLGTNPYTSDPMVELRIQRVIFKIPSLLSKLVETAPPTERGRKSSAPCRSRIRKDMDADWEHVPADRAKISNVFSRGTWNMRKKLKGVIGSQGKDITPSGEVEQRLVPKVVAPAGAANRQQQVSGKRKRIRDLLPPASKALSTPNRDKKLPVSKVSGRLPNGHKQSVNEHKQSVNGRKQSVKRKKRIEDLLPSAAKDTGLSNGNQQPSTAEPTVFTELSSGHGGTPKKERGLTNLSDKPMEVVRHSNGDQPLPLSESKRHRGLLNGHGQQSGVGTFTHDHGNGDSQLPWEQFRAYGRRSKAGVNLPTPPTEGLMVEEVPVRSPTEEERRSVQDRGDAADVMDGRKDIDVSQMGRRMDEIHEYAMERAATLLATAESMSRDLDNCDLPNTGDSQPPQKRGRYCDGLKPNILIQSPIFQKNNRYCNGRIKWKVMTQVPDNPERAIVLHQEPGAQVQNSILEADVHLLVAADHISRNPLYSAMTGSQNLARICHGYMGSDSAHPQISEGKEQYSNDHIKWKMISQVPGNPELCQGPRTRRKWSLREADAVESFQKLRDGRSTVGTNDLVMPRSADDKAAPNSTCGGTEAEHPNTPIRSGRMVRQTEQLTEFQPSVPSRALVPRVGCTSPQICKRSEAKEDVKAKCQVEDVCMPCNFAPFKKGSCQGLSTHFSRKRTLTAAESMKRENNLALMKKRLCLAGGLKKWLLDNGLEQFWPILEERKINHFSLLKLTMESLKEMGSIPVGPRRKLIHGISCLTQPSSSKFLVLNHIRV